MRRLTWLADYSCKTRLTDSSRGFVAGLQFRHGPVSVSCAVILKSVRQHSSRGARMTTDDEAQSTRRLGFRQLLHLLQVVAQIDPERLALDREDHKIDPHRNDLSCQTGDVEFASGGKPGLSICGWIV